jgi:ribosomal protein S18 acetylase RimI-like enzyme
MKSYVFQKESDIQSIRELITRLPNKSTIVDFEEMMIINSVRNTTRIWKCDNKVIGFAFVDKYNNLRFEIDPEFHSIQIENEIVGWGIICIKARNAETGENNALDASFSKENTWQIAMLVRLGFVRENFRSLRFERFLNKPIIEYAFPDGFSVRSVKGDQEVENLVVLHRAAFGTDNMTAEERLAIMNVPQYDRELDLVVISPNCELAAFCICKIDEKNDNVGYSDPIGTHPKYRKLGLAKAIVTVGFQFLQKKGVKVVEVGTNSENIAMQQLAEVLGFEVVSEKLWFSKKIL